jgi:hypothetical protein
MRKGVTRSVTAFPYLLCQAHAEIEFELESQHVLCIRGVLEHNNACLSVEISGQPHVTVHPNVSKIALQMATNGASFHQILDRNWALCDSRAYPNQAHDPLGSKYHWRLASSDSSPLYSCFGTGCRRALRVSRRFQNVATRFLHQLDWTA